MTIETIVTFSFFIAGIAILWRNFLHDVRWAKTRVESFPYLISHILFCGLCFTFWTTFFFLVYTKTYNDGLFPFFINWMSVGFLATFFRYLFVLVQESSQIFFKKNHADHSH